MKKFLRLFVCSCALLSFPGLLSAQAPNLGTVSSFVLFTITGAVANTGPSIITGDVGTNTGAISGFGTINGNVHNTDLVTAQCSIDLLLAYVQLNNTPTTIVHTPVLGNGETLYPGVYDLAAAGSVAGTLTLDAQGDSGAVFIFKIGGAFTTGASTTVNLINGASACNVFWKAEGAIAMAASTIMRGTLISNNGAVSMAAGGTLEGRMLSTTGAVSVDNVVAVVGCTSAIIWTGAVSTDWNVQGNWLYGVIPCSTTSATIPGGLTNYPLLNTGSGSVYSIILQSGSSVTITGGKLQVAGNIYNDGTFSASQGTVEFNGLSPQTISASAFSGNIVKNLVISNNVTLLGSEVLTGILSFGNVNNKTFNSAGHLTLRSDATNTALIADITNNNTNSGNAYSGITTVERYIPALDRRAYRLLGPSVNSTNSIHANWQEGATYNQDDPKPLYGTQITGPSPDQYHGFDATQTGQASLFLFANNSFVKIANTDVLKLDAKTGYLLFVRGNRSYDLSQPQPGPFVSSSTTMRATGTVLTGTQTFTATSDTDFVLVTNPYPAALNWTAIAANNPGFESYYTYWEPKIGVSGGYVTVSQNGISSPATNATSQIQSGQAFLVKGKTLGVYPVLTIREPDKATVNNINVFAPQSTLKKFESSLYFYDAFGQKILADGAVALYDNSYSKGLDKDDAEEEPNWYENIAILKEGKHLSIESHPDYTGSDTMQFFISHLKNRAYQLELVPNFVQSGLTGYFIDNFLPSNNTTINFSDTTRITFDVTADPLSSASDRFQIIFNLQVVLPVTLTDLKAYRHADGIAVAWKVENQLDMTGYEVERSANGIDFIKEAFVVASGNISDQYTSLDSDPLTGINYYRIKSIDKDGLSRYSNIVSLDISTEASISLFSNPVTNSVMVLKMDMPKGAYSITVINSLGQVMMTRSLSHQEGVSSERISLTPNILPGTYLLTVLKPDGKAITLKMFVN
jgi:hypothetical protein